MRNHRLFKLVRDAAKSAFARRKSGAEKTRMIIIDRKSVTFPVAALENIETTARDLSSHFEEFTRSNLEEGWTRDGMSIPSIFPPIDWNAHNRSFSYHLHAWDAIADLLIRHSVRGGDDYFEACLAHARAWLEEFQAPLIGKDSEAELDALVSPHMPVAWYDMAVGLRVFRIAYILDVISRHDRYAADVSLFSEGLAFHLKLLRRDHFFREHSNHGLYQALGQMAAARRFPEFPEIDIDKKIGQERLSRLLSNHFSIEGPHKEHSPGYHYMLMGSLINARRSGLLADDENAALLSRIEDAFQWMVRPDFGLASTGDSDPRILLRGEIIADLYSNGPLQYIISGASMGSAPPAGVKPYLDAGYAFARMYEPGVEPEFGNASYLAQMAAFHSRVHKHADHLTFIWFDRGRDILIDPGRYAYAGRTEAGSDLFNQGFWYADPKRIYVESTRAHNCVEIDDRSYPRRNVKPWGSALRYAGEQDGLAVTDCDVVHERTIRHRRVLVMGPGHFLLVLDWLNDRTGDHDYRQWFQFAPDWVVEGAAGGYRARIPARTQREPAEAVDAAGAPPPAPGRDSAAEDELSVFNLVDDNACAAPVRGQEEPRLQGWMSDAAYSLIPSTSICVEGLDRQMGRFATLFVFGGDAELDRAATRFNISLRTGSIAWRDGKGKHVLKLAMQEPGDVKAILETVS